MNASRHSYNCGCQVCNPDQCYECGDYAIRGIVFKKAIVDLDPGDPEVGPDPCIQTVAICDGCWPKYKKYARPEEREICVSVSDSFLVHEHAHFGGNSCLSSESLPAWLMGACETYEGGDLGRPWKLFVSVDHCKHPIN